jgi:triosephosphate isomerase
MARRAIIAGNWKMNKGPAEAAELARGVLRGTRDVRAEVVVAPTFVALAAVADVIRGSHVALAAQNLHWEDSGAYTGEISAPMLAELGCRYVIIGHSERRQLFGETDETVNRKVRAALAHGLVPIVCVGESLEEREAGETRARVGRQLAGGLDGISGEDVGRMVLAYEPIWAIGTGRTASDEQAQEVHAFIREQVAERWGSQTASALRIQYGGSVKSSNVAGLMSCADIDGALVGGASLQADGFSQLVSNAD